MWTVETVQMRHSLESQREVAQQHAGARQPGRRLAKVGLTCSSSNTILAVGERAARACRAKMGSSFQQAEVATTKDTNHPESSLAAQLKPKSAESAKSAGAQQGGCPYTAAIAKLLAYTITNLGKGQAGISDKYGGEKTFQSRSTEVSKTPTPKWAPTFPTEGGVK